mgnify:CR=1 FL=1
MVQWHCAGIIFFFYLYKMVQGVDENTSSFASKEIGCKTCILWPFSLLKIVVFGG